jgi:hypothetical protein
LYQRSSNLVSSIWAVLLGAFFIAGIVGELWNFGFFVSLFFTLYIREYAVPVQYKQPAVYTIINNEK